MQLQEQIEQTLRATGDKRMTEWANVMKLARTKIRYGRITLILRDGCIARIEKTDTYYSPDDTDVV